MFQDVSHAHRSPVGCIGDLRAVVEENVVFDLEAELSKAFWLRTRCDVVDNGCPVLVFVSHMLPLILLIVASRRLSSYRSDNRIWDIVS
jgi:hypothetical protein